MQLKKRRKFKFLRNFPFASILSITSKLCKAQWPHGRAVWVRALARVIVLCCILGQGTQTLTVSLFTQAYKRVLADLMPRGNPVMDQHPIWGEGSRNTPSSIMLKKPEIGAAALKGVLARMQTLPTLILCLQMYTVQSFLLSKGSLKIISCSNRNTCRLHGLRVSGSATVNVS